MADIALYSPKIKNKKVKEKTLSSFLKFFQFFCFLGYGTLVLSKFLGFGICQQKRSHFVNLCNHLKKCTRGK